MESIPIRLEDSFVKISPNSKKHMRYQVLLTATGLQVTKKVNETKTSQEFFPIGDIIGYRCQRRQLPPAKRCLQFNSNPCILIDNTMDNVDTSDSSAYLTIMSYIKHHKDSKRNQIHLTLRFCKYGNYQQNHAEAQHWTNVINLLRHQHNPDYRIDLLYKYLVIVNPASGQGQGCLLFQKNVRVMLENAKIQYELEVTKRANFARDLIRNKDLEKFHNIVIVGGDGLIFEIINGIFERVDWFEVFQNLCIGIVPSGSGNGVIKSICYQFHEFYNHKSVIGPILTLVRHKKHPIDIVRVETKSKIMYSLLSIGWGLIADVDIESEKIRKLGSKRFTIWSLIRLMRLRSYKGRIWYLPIHTSSERRTHEVPPNDPNSFTEIPLNSRRKLSRMESWHSTKSRRDSFVSTTDTVYGSFVENVGEFDQTQPIYGPPSNIPSLSTSLEFEFELESNWKMIDDEFIMVHASYQSHLSADCNFIPDATLNGGVIWLMVLRKGLSRNEILNFLMCLKHGTHADLIAGNDLIQLISCKAFRLEPANCDQNSGNITVDGELVDYGPIQAEVFPDIVQVLVP